MAHRVSGRPTEQHPPTPSPTLLRSEPGRTDGLSAPPAIASDVETYRGKSSRQWRHTEPYGARADDHETPTWL